MPQQLLALFPTPCPDFLGLRFLRVSLPIRDYRILLHQHGRNHESFSLRVYYVYTLQSEQRHYIFVALRMIVNASG